MSAEIIPLPVVRIERVVDDLPNPGNGAREALVNLCRDFYPDFDQDDLEGYADHVLAGLWLRGFKVVPLEPADLESSA